jgi:hypothetical protein
MAAVARPGFCENRDRPMSKTPKPSSITPVETGKAPVRVRLKRLNCNEAIPYPPDGQAREWWQRLKNAFGTASSAFVGTSLQQLIAAARLPNSGISEPAVNASLAFIEGAKPEGEVECALVIQMACTHTAAMAVLHRLGGGHGGDRSFAAMASAAARLLRAYATQFETLAAPTTRPHPSTGQAPARSQAERPSPRCTIHSGAQGVVGIINSGKDSSGEQDRSPTLDSSSQSKSESSGEQDRSPTFATNLHHRA